ncbi:MAG: potassium transporter Kup [Segetibacter sp.]|nr:potassium transporter Kup [Segetibacter sp.]
MSAPNNKVSAAGLIIALGIIYGDIGTSPLYVLNAITNGKVISELLILGSLSCIIWTLTLQTTVKYVILTLKADNRGEGGIFSLFALVRRRRRWLVFTAMIGGAALLADGMITPPISVTSAIEGLRNIDALGFISDQTIVYIVLAIITGLFFLQQFGTASIGKLFGPIMGCWFAMLAVLGCSHFADDLGIFRALNPYYAIKLLTTYQEGFWILGGVFLCTTGAEALYSDLGHCGRENIRLSWIFVKTCLLLNYFGQGAWLLSNYNGKTITDAMITDGFNPFYAIMPSWFLVPGIVIATTAAVIASQALISGSFTLISEAIRLNLWPKMKIRYPSEAKGQLFVPGINMLLFLGCIGVVLYFKKSTNMESAYGLAITMCMIATTILFANFLILRRTAPVLVFLYLSVYLAIELSFLTANLDKFHHGGYVSLIMGGLLFVVMYVWYRARKIKNRYIEFVSLDDYIGKLEDLSNDKSIIKHATHLVYMTSADNPREIEHKIMYSILHRKPKRADIYWFVHVHTVDEPYTSEYSVNHIIPNDIIRVEFRLGFRVQPRINLMFREVVKDLVANKEVNITSRYESLERNNIVGDFQFVVMEKFLSNDNELPFLERIIMRIHFWLKDHSLSEAKSFGLDTSYVTVEKFALVVSPISNVKLQRIFKKGEEAY